MKESDASAMNGASVGFQQRHTRNIVDVTTCNVASQAINTKYKEMRKKLLGTNCSLPATHQQPEGPLLLRESEGGVVVTNPLDEVTQTVGGVQFYFKAREFFQNNPYVLPLLVDHVVQKAVGHGCNFLIDAYCGSGLFALCSASQFRAVYGVEISALSVNAARHNAKQNNITNVTFLKGEADLIFGKLKAVPAQQTVVVVDPPRKGCDASFLIQLFAFRPRKIVYISCEPTTQARDAARIVKEGYEIIDVTPFDMFPQTRHIENVITFALK